MAAQLEGLTTAHLGRTWIALSSVDSTNNYLKEQAFSLPHGTLVTAREQTKGRGRRGNTWSFRPGSALAMSVLLHKIPQQSLTHLPLLCGLALTRGLSCGCTLKWSNDVLLNGRKLCGILCESRIGETISAVCGFGINLTQTREDFQAAGLPYAASILSETGENLTPEAAAAQVLNALEAIWEQYCREGFESLREEYCRVCVTLGRPVRVLYEGSTVEGTAVDIAGDGSLLCRTPQGDITVRAGEASVRGLYGYV